MQPVEEIRRANLLLLIQESGSAARLAALSGLAAPYISQVSRAVPNSKGKGVRVMGPDVARRLETKMGKPRGWMDTDHSALNIAADLNGREGQMVGLFRLLSEADQAQVINELTRRLKQSPPLTGLREAAESPDLRH
jgi:hypothetical protein